MYRRFNKNRKAHIASSSGNYFNSLFNKNRFIKFYLFRFNPLFHFAVAGYLKICADLTVLIEPQWIVVKERYLFCFMLQKNPQER